MSQDALRDEIIYALRQGTVPPRGLELFATGLEPLVAQVRAELEHVGRGHGLSKWLRGDYGAGKTFTARHLAAVARTLGFATTEVQVSVNDTPLHKLETVYRRLMERLETPSDPPSALQPIVDGWLYDVGDKVTRLRGLSEDDPSFPTACEQQIEDELTDISRVNPAFAAAPRWRVTALWLRGCSPGSPGSPTPGGPSRRRLASGVRWTGKRRSHSSAGCCASCGNPGIRAW